MSKRFKINRFYLWIRCYCYNNAYLLYLKRNHRKLSNVIIALSAPYILLRWASLAFYEWAIGKKLIAAKVAKDNLRHFDHEMAMVSISKNEGPYVKEWIEFHRLVGFTKFYFYDNESEDETAQVLKPYVEQGLVEYTLIKGKGRQLDAYNDAIKKHKDQCRWMAFLDMDEYLMPAKPFEPIAKVVSELTRKAGGGAVGVGVNWCIYGTSHLEKTPKGLTSENFIYRGTNKRGGNYHIKTVCNPRFVKDYISPHYPLFKVGAYNVNDSDGERLWGWFCLDVKWQNLRVNHYYCKSKEQYIKKISRGLGDRDGSYDTSRFNYYDLNDEKDLSMMVYADELKKRL